MRRLLAMLLLLELAIALIPGHGGFIHRRDFDQAFFAYYQNPTRQNRVELNRQRRLNELARLEDSAVAFGGLAAVTLVAVAARAHFLRKRTRCAADFE
jgi:hypothetical protein